MGSEVNDGSYLILDIDDFSTKAVLIDRTAEGYYIKGMVQAMSTADLPSLDVTIGVEKAVKDLSRKVHKELWTPEGPSKTHRFLCSSNTGGGLYMMVAGITDMISTESAQRAALGAGALLVDVFSRSDPRPDFDIIDRMRSIKPDMFLLAGGTDGGAVKQVLDMAHLIGVADVKPRFGSEFKLPVIFAGNVEAREEVSDTLSEKRYATKAVENVRPIIERENLGPAREAIYDSFMQHVIIHSPGYSKLVRWIDEPLVPTQAAIGNILYAYALKRQVNLLAVDVGGATTDVYSVYNGIFNRSLNADIGLTYGISNVMKVTGIQNMTRWIPKEMSEREVRNIIGNLMIHPSRSQTPDEVLVQQAAAREAMRIAVEHHKGIASRLKGLQVKRTVADIFNQTLEPTYLNMMKTQAIIGRGKVFAQSPIAEATLILLDSLQPEGVTEIMVDKLDLMPHLGMLSKVNPEAAARLFSKECLLRLATCVAPRGRSNRSEVAVRVRMVKPDGAAVEEEVCSGELKTLPLGNGETAKLEVTPKRGLDVGMGRGKRLEVELAGSEIGLVLDARGRPLDIPAEKNVLVRWTKSLASDSRPRIQGGGVV